MALISGLYHTQAALTVAQSIVVEHCAFMEPGSQWDLEVRCLFKENWRSIREVCPDADVELKSNELVVTLPPLQEELVIAAFGKPGEKDMKRMQMAFFGRRPINGRNWNVSAHLFDDTVMAFENVYKKEKQKGNKLLTALAGLFVSNNDEDIKIELHDLEPGWQIKGSNVKTMKSTDAWNSPENGTDFPFCRFETCHVDVTKQSFFCAITASHGTDTTKAKIMEVFKQQNENDEINEDSQTLKDVAAIVDSDEDEINDSDINQGGEALKHAETNDNSEILQERHPLLGFVDRGLKCLRFLDMQLDEGLKKLKNVTGKVTRPAEALFNCLKKPPDSLTVEAVKTQLDRMDKKELFRTCYLGYPLDTIKQPGPEVYQNRKELPDLDENLDLGLFSVYLLVVCLILYLVGLWMKFNPHDPGEDVLAHAMIIDAAALGIFVFLLLTTDLCCSKPSKFIYKINTEGSQRPSLVSLIPLLIPVWRRLPIIKSL